MNFSLRKGLDIAVDGAPEQVVGATRDVSSVAVLGRDFPGVRPEFRVAEGDRVCAGQVLFIDRKRPRIRFAAPACGTVEHIVAGHRRMLDKLIIRVEGDGAETFRQAATARDRETLREVLLSSGSWPAFRTRPFGRIPDPESMPAAIFVTAIETDPLAADARIILDRHIEAFKQGVGALAHLTDGPVFVCQPPGPELVQSEERLRVASFAGPHPAGLPGTHIHHLMPASAKRTVWHIGYQDVIAVGHLLETGRLWTERTVALGGPGMRQPRLTRTRLGASIEDLIAGETRDGAVQLVSGSVLSGRSSAYLGRYHTQVTVLKNGWPARPRSLLGTVSGWLPRAASGGPIIPIESLDAAMPLDILPLPLMRALAIGDVETAERLGCLELVEEDVALLSHLCPDGADYGALLRQILDELEGGGR
ncbi:NADH:ubiquinone reductase (Na(+)-transporting) subunit A [Nitratireductor mangrovi]|uniref:Na(+)-translocating NADH-quinone reductase subunit A n=2 Tax=Nitratireductor mangrovi TaxID=2599600 RepID=A0A5B8L671_9HYPH|nr:NADH:ubiquinone reductase (Na(+)-transporting) subunit A [Nitratireductor mangrovi]